MLVRRDNTISSIRTKRAVDHDSVTMTSPTSMSILPTLCCSQLHHQCEDIVWLVRADSSAKMKTLLRIYYMARRRQKETMILWQIAVRWDPFLSNQGPISSSWGPWLWLLYDAQSEFIMWRCNPWWFHQIEPIWPTKGHSLFTNPKRKIWKYFIPTPGGLANCPPDGKGAFCCNCNMQSWMRTPVEPGVDWGLPAYIVDVNFRASDCLQKKILKQPMQQWSFWFQWWGFKYIFRLLRLHAPNICRCRMKPVIQHAYKHSY